MSTAAPARRGVLGTARDVVPVAVLACIVAAVATAGAAALARSAGVTFAVSGRVIPPSAFPFWTVVGAVLGLVAALVLQDRRRFVAAALAGTAASFVPPVVASDDTPTAVVLVALHLLAAAVLVPALAVRLHDR